MEKANDLSNKQFSLKVLDIYGVNAEGVLHVKTTIFRLSGLLLLCLCCSIGSLLAAELPTVVPLPELRDGVTAPSRLATDAAGHLYVADRRQHAVLQFDATGACLARFDSVPVSGSGLAVSADGRYLFIADQHAVNILSAASGETVGMLGAEDEFSMAGAIAIDSEGYVFVADSSERLVKVYQLQTDEGGLSGQLQYSFGQGRFASIFALAIDRSANEVYVADGILTYSRQPRVEVFNLSGDWLRTLNYDGGFGPEKLGFVGEIGFEDAGRSYFADKKNGNLRVLDSTGRVLGSLFHSGYAADELWQPRGLAYLPGSQAGSGWLLVSNSDGRISRFALDGAVLPDPDDGSSAATNTPPPIPEPLSPQSGSQVASALPNLSFRPVSDTDGDAVSYRLQVYKEDQLIEELSVPEDAEPFASVSVPLNENALYRWRVQAFDGSAVSGYSAAQDFYVNAVAEAPNAPVLLLPGNNAALAGADSFTWSVADDPDPANTLHYRLQLSAAADFSQLLCEQSLDQTEFVLNQVAAYASLIPGQSYWWRVLAEDETNLLSAAGAGRQFIYESTGLEITANAPGAKVYLGGNHGYYGRYLGETPLSLHDLSPGPQTLVLTAPGFDPQVLQLELLPRQIVSRQVHLQPALLPRTQRPIPLLAEKHVLRTEGGGAPFAVDWDNDSMTDLLVGEGSGALVLYRRTASDKIRFDAGQRLATPAIIGASPFVVDWDNDGRKDLLVGAADGTLHLLLGTGSDNAPSFGDSRYLETDFGVLDVGDSATPWVTDWDRDGRKDLLVGSATGQLSLLRNIGSDAAVQLAAPVILLQSKEPLAPLVADWDGDGQAELLLVLPGRVITTKIGKRGALTFGQSLFELPKGGRNRFEQIAGLRGFMINLDNAGPKDLLIGNAAGDLYFVRPKGDKPVPALQEVLEVRVARLAELASESRGRQVAKLKAALRSENLSKVARLAAELAEKSDGELAQEAAELAALLQ